MTDINHTTMHQYRIIQGHLESYIEVGQGTDDLKKTATQAEGRSPKTTHYIIRHMEPIWRDSPDVKDERVDKLLDWFDIDEEECGMDAT